MYSLSESSKAFGALSTTNDTIPLTFIESKSNTQSYRITCKETEVVMGTKFSEKAFFNLHTWW